LPATFISLFVLSYRIVAVGSIGKVVKVVKDKQGISPYFAEISSVFSILSILLLLTGCVPKAAFSVVLAKKTQYATEPMSYRQLAALYISHMSLDEELGQLFMVGYNESTYSPDLERMISEQYAGGVILYQDQIQTLSQTRHDISEMQQHARLPLLIATDEEGGLVDRLANVFPPRPSAFSIYYSGNPARAAQWGDQTAHDLLSLGFNEDLAPDSDVELVAGPDQLTRTFGKTPQSVITFAGAYMRAMQHDNVIACIKHFPGLGAATSDAHLDLPVVRRTKAQIYAVELAPFKAFVQTQTAFEQPGMVMATDVLMPAIDPHLPAELSPTFITSILRQQFGYQGMVITDSLYMKGISDQWNLDQAAIMALNAGDDMLLGIVGSDQMSSAISSLKLALRRGTLSKSRIDEAVSRILALKMQYHLLPVTPPAP
jgi:beta-N-acetylhexosaminidase